MNATRIWCAVWIVMAAGAWTVSGEEGVADPPPQALTAQVARTWVDDNPAAIDAMLAQLARPVSSEGWTLNETPLEEFVGFLRDDVGLNVVVDRFALDHLGIGLDEPLTAMVQGTSISSALRLVLGPHDLSYDVRGGVLVITSKDALGEHQMLAVYPVADLVATGEGDDYDTLVNAIVATVATDSWAQNGGGTAEIRSIPTRGAIVVTQSLEPHEQLLRLLESLRKNPARRGDLVKREPHEPEGSDPPAGVGPTDSKPVPSQRPGGGMF